MNIWNQVSENKIRELFLSKLCDITCDMQTNSYHLLCIEYVLSLTVYDIFIDWTLALAVFYLLAC